MAEKALRLGVVVGTAISLAACATVLGLGDFAYTPGQEGEGGVADASSDASIAPPSCLYDGGASTAPYAFVPGVADLEQIAVGHGNVLWVSTTAPGVSSCPVCGPGCAGDAGALVSSAPAADQIALDDGGVYWDDEVSLAHLTSIAGCLLDDGGCYTQNSDQQLWTAVGPAITALGVYDGNLYFAAGGVYRCPTGGCDAGMTTLSDAGTAVSVFAAGPTGIFWAASGVMERWLADAGLEQLPITTQITTGIVADDDNIYWTSAPPDLGNSQGNGGSAALGKGFVASCPLSAFGGQCMAATIGGANLPTSLAMDDTYIYWADIGVPTAAFPKDGSGLIQRAKRCRGLCPLSWSAETIAKAQQLPDNVVVDSDYVYWTTSESLAGPTRGPGTVMRMRKPP